MSKHTKKSKIKIITIPMDCLRDKTVKYICNLLLWTRVFSWRLMFIYISRISEQVRKWLCNLIKFKMRNLSQQHCSHSHARESPAIYRHVEVTCITSSFHGEGRLGLISVLGVSSLPQFQRYFCLNFEPSQQCVILCFSFRFILTTNERSVSQLGKTQRN